jgi:arylsulfatase A-like enzyme
MMNSNCGKKFLKAGEKKFRKNTVLNSSLLCLEILLVFFCLTGCNAKPRNVILISIDTMRADALYKTPVPFLSDFSADAAVFDRAFTTAPITLPAHTSLLSGLYPPSHGVRNNGTFRAGDDLTLMPEIAKQNGMSTAAFVGAFPLAKQFGLNQGFDIYDDEFSAANNAEGNFSFAERSAEQVRLSAQKWLESRTSSQPFFLFLHFFDPHHPYLTHGYGNLQPYRQEIAYVDHQLGEFFQFLERKKLHENNLIIITSDHGEAFGEHGEISHTLFVYNTTLHIPLLIQGPGIDAQKRPEVVRIVDILPTVAELMEWKIGDAIDGVSICPLFRSEPLKPLESYAESFAPALDFGWSPLASLQTKDAKYIQAPRPEFYDLQNDPQEQSNKIGPQADALKVKLETILRRAPVAKAAHIPDAQEREKLAALGYISGGRTKINWNGPDPKDRIAIARKIAELSMSPISLSQKAHEYERLVQQDPSNPLLLMRYGEILLKLQQFQFAELAFRRVLELGYNSAAPYNGLAASLYYQERIPEAESVLQKAVTDGLADAETYFNLAEFLYHRGARAEAFTYYDRSTQLGHRLARQRKAELQR